MKEVVIGIIAIIVMTLTFITGTNFGKYLNESSKIYYESAYSSLNAEVIRLNDMNLKLASRNKELANSLDSFLTIERVYFNDINRYKYGTEEINRVLARCILAASEAYELDSDLLYAVIASESSFNVKTIHNHHQVKGMSGIHTKYWVSILKDENILVSKEQLNTSCASIEASAYILSTLQNRSTTNLQAIHRYKGYSSEGYKQATTTLNIYNKIKGDSNDSN
jgi:hypothetical protein